MNEPLDKYAERLQDLRALLQERELDALLVPHDDVFLSYELNPDNEELAFLTGFTGSAGFAAVRIAADDTDTEEVTLTDGSSVTLQTAAAVFVDGQLNT